MAQGHLAMVKGVYDFWARGDFIIDPDLMTGGFVRHRRREAVEPGSHSGELELRLAFLWSVRDGKLASMEQFADPAEAMRAAGMA